MTRDIKFTSYGIPYILEFENVSVAPKRRSKETHRHDQDQTLAHHDPCLIAQSGISESPYASTPSPSSSTTSFCHIESPPPAPRFPSFSLGSPSSLFGRKTCGASPEQCPSSHHPIPSQSSNSSCSTRYGISQCTKPLPPPPPPTQGVSGIHDIFIQFAPRDRFPQMNRKDRLVHLQKTISTAVLEAGMNSSPGNTTGLREPPLNGGNVTQGSRGYRTTDALFCGTYGQMTDALKGAGLSATPCVEEGLSGCTRLGALFVARNDASGVQLRKITLWG